MECCYDVCFSPIQNNTTLKRQEIGAVPPRVLVLFKITQL